MRFFKKKDENILGVLHIVIRKDDNNIRILTTLMGVDPKYHPELNDIPEIKNLFELVEIFRNRAATHPKDEIASKKH